MRKDRNKGFSKLLKKQKGGSMNKSWSHSSRRWWCTSAENHSTESGTSGTLSVARGHTQDLARKLLKDHASNGPILHSDEPDGQDPQYHQAISDVGGLWVIVGKVRQRGQPPPFSQKSTPCSTSEESLISVDLYRQVGDEDCGDDDDGVWWKRATARHKSGWGLRTLGHRFGSWTGASPCLVLLLPTRNRRNWEELWSNQTKNPFLIVTSNCKHRGYLMNSLFSDFIVIMYIYQGFIYWYHALIRKSVHTAYVYMLS